MESKLFIIVALFIICGGITAQNDAWFYLRAKDTLVAPSFHEINDELQYTGSDEVLASVLSKYKVSIFKKTYRNANRANLKKTFFVIAEDESLLEDLLVNVPHLFVWGEIISEEDKKIFEPNDYGLTSTIGDNLGVQVNLDYYDFLGLPQAWYYTTGNKDIVIGISDGAVDLEDIEFKGKTTEFKRASYAKGHGISVAFTAAGRGDNAYGIPGVCYDCSIYTTSYSHFTTLSQLVELSNAGVKVINCSWGLKKDYEAAQQAVYDMLENGTVIVSTGANMPILKTKGVAYYYPASYDKVIGISTGFHRYEDYRENILETPHKEGVLYYAQNLRWHVGANVGFVDNDTTQIPRKIYKRSIKNLNSEIDILGPGMGLFRYSQYYEKKIIDFGKGQTSGVAPLITGTIGLMFSLYPCLPANEVESILKMTSTNIDSVQANKPYKGLYGSGMLHTGRAVEMVYKLYAEKETAYIENQEFLRWDFKISSLSKEIRIRNQKFTDNATLKVVAKNRIVIGVNTVLKPNKSGSISLKIDPTMEKECDLVLRDPSILRK
ncbi:MAG: S8/S53 family peptidase [Flavobacteriaceae bacterium]|nr:S8/S53 family peptidase [Flavobacteriaceae bacterium]